MLSKKRIEAYPIGGVTHGSASVGIKKLNRPDLLVTLLKEGSTVSGVFTQNQFCAAPVQICKRRLTDSSAIRALVVNTGIANAGTGTQGLSNAEEVCKKLATRIGVHQDAVLPFSTGVIMEHLPVNRLVRGFDDCIKNQKLEGWEDAAQTILTTDTTTKISSRTLELQGLRVAITGIAKGSGMIQPNMATMLAFVATDASLSRSMANKINEYAVERSFNCISVDGDTSTNDSCVLIATGESGLPMISSEDDPNFQILLTEITSVFTDLAKKIVLDGEGATKFVEVNIEDGGSREECKKIAFSIANSPLVKTALFASDPNLGRIMSAIGAAGVENLDTSKIELYLGDLLVSTQGGIAAEYREDDAKRIMQEDEIRILVKLNRGTKKAAIWTCDLSYDYVKINAEYRS